MEIILNNIIPAPLRETDLSGSMAWNTEGVEFAPGKKYLVKAPSGLGKTTLLSMIFGIRRDYTGNLLIGGSSARDFSLNKWASLRKESISYVFQGLRLFPELSAYENIQIKNRLVKFYPDSRIKEMAAQTKVENLLGKEARYLSFGQQQRFALIRALCQPFTMLLLDEPFSHLDTANIELALGLIETECEKQKAGFILTSLGDDYGINYDEILEL